MATRERKTRKKAGTGGAKKASVPAARPAARKVSRAKNNGARSPARDGRPVDVDSESPRFARLVADPELREQLVRVRAPVDEHRPRVQPQAIDDPGLRAPADVRELLEHSYARSAGAQLMGDSQPCGPGTHDGQIQCAPAVHPLTDSTLADWLGWLAGALRPRRHRRSTYKCTFLF